MSFTQSGLPSSTPPSAAGESLKIAAEDASRSIHAPAMRVQDAPYRCQLYNSVSRRGNKSMYIDRHCNVEPTVQKRRRTHATLSLCRLFRVRVALPMRCPAS
ncbi:hypothetical protein [Sphingomonas metalli]|uniref:hypothetical protein n=1 Tax=Sphingomonas metalli TaxID=1779358 RepID=UPI0016641437|nr:hypothetical protein [Sphingomonas metalli]